MKKKDKQRRKREKNVGEKNVEEKILFEISYRFRVDLGKKIIEIW